MGLEVLKGACRAHFRGDDTDQVVFNSQHVHGPDHIVFRDQHQGTPKTLVFLSFPVKLYTDDHISQKKRGVIILWFKCKPVLYLVLQTDLPVFSYSGKSARICPIIAFQLERD